MTKKELLENEEFIKASDDAEIIISYTDFYGDQEMEPTPHYTSFGVLYL